MLLLLAALLLRVSSAAECYCNSGAKYQCAQNVKFMASDKKVDNIRGSWESACAECSRERYTAYKYTPVSQAIQLQGHADHMCFSCYKTFTGIYIKTQRTEKWQEYGGVTGGSVFCTAPASGSRSLNRPQSAPVPEVPERVVAAVCPVLSKAACEAAPNCKVKKQGKRGVMRKCQQLRCKKNKTEEKCLARAWCEYISYANGKKNRCTEIHELD